jgi:chorismate-pyruvate lyase
MGLAKALSHLEVRSGQFRVDYLLHHGARPDGDMNVGLDVDQASRMNSRKFGMA